jgi:hypothetical protein
LLILNTTLLL